jgi:hypothetical protein
MINTIKGNWKYMYTMLSPQKVYSVKPWKYGLYPSALSHPVSTPDGLSRAMKAKAKGTPAKLEATPQNVIRLERIKGGSPPRIAEYASRNPKRPPPREVRRLILMLIQ